jgi:hypothetical protein
MLKRCSHPQFSKWYGKIKVCDKWKLSYDAFCKDVGPKPSSAHTLDRIDPSGDYEPSNVRWATRTVQSRNTKLHDTNKTGARGVSWSKAKGRWRAAIYVNNKQTHIGYFADFAAAVAARKAAELRLWMS